MLPEADAPRRTLRQCPPNRSLIPSQYFDLVLCVDILHHCDVPKSLLEIQRVSKPGALLVWSEIYCHSLTFQLRHSRLGEFIWQSLHRWVYGSDRPYITEDERPLSERDIDAIASSLTEVQVDYWDGITGRFWPGRSRRASKLDRGLFSLAGRHIKSLLACRSTGHGVKSAGA